MADSKCMALTAVDLSFSDQILASHPVRRGCTSSLSLRNTKVLLRNHTPLTAGVRVLAMHRSCPRQHLRPCLGFPSAEPQRYSRTHNRWLSTGISLLVPALWNQRKANYSFLPQQLLNCSSGAPAPSCYRIRLGVACAFPTLASFGSSCLWLKGSSFAMFQGPVPQSSCAVSAGRESPRSTASPRDHGHPKHALLAPAMAIVCPQDAPISHVPTLEVCSHSAQAILPDSPIDPIPWASCLNCFLSLCQGFSLHSLQFQVVMSPFLSCTVRTLFQQLFPPGSRLQSLSNYAAWLLQWGHLC